MWVVKLGGSLSREPALLPWLTFLATQGRGRVVVVPGGGEFADVARETQAHWALDDLAAHNMAVLGMAQTAVLLNGLQPALQIVARSADLPHALRQGRAAVWLPLELLREQPDELTSWDVTADSLALWLARRLHAERLLVVKSCPVAARHTLADLSAAGVLDRRFAQWAADAGPVIDVVPHTALETVRGWLQHDDGPCVPADPDAAAS
jgi:aspartokinase-like uncharacterized kinase